MSTKTEKPAGPPPLPVSRMRHYLTVRLYRRPSGRYTAVCGDLQTDDANAGVAARRVVALAEKTP